MGQKEYTPDERQRALMDAVVSIRIGGESIIDQLNEAMDLIVAAGDMLDTEHTTKARASQRINTMASNLLFDVTNYMAGEDPKESGFTVSYQAKLPIAERGK